MEEANKSIVKTLENGQYYIDAKNWYLLKFINPFIERNVVALLTIFFLISASIALYFYEKIVDQDFEVKFLLKTEDITDHYAVIKSLGSYDKNPQKLLEAYMVKLYVIKRESYEYNKIDEQSNFVKNSSSPDVFNDFDKQYSINNPDSPIVLYQKYTTKNITVNSVNEDPQKKGVYIVKFDATTFDTRESSSETSSWIARVRFNMSDIAESMEKDSKKLDYQVQEYTVMKN